jgi:hypothetical protein
MAEIIKLEENSNIFACHYTSITVACEHILPSQKIRFSPLSGMNDPRENKARFDGVSWTGEDPPTNDLHMIREQFIDKQLKYSKIFCTTIDSDKNPYRLNTKRCFGRPRMWAQYGDNHKGVCFVFDRESLKSKILKSVPDGMEFWADNIEYKDDLKNVSAGSSTFYYKRADWGKIEVAIKNHIERYKEAFFFRKDSDWIGESEWRGVIYQEKEGHVYFGFGDSLKAIVMGVDCPDVYLPTLQKLAKSIPIFKLDWEAAKEDFSCYDAQRLYVSKVSSGIY